MKENRNIYEAENPAKNACDLVSDKAGTIVSMITRKGTPLRKKGDFCKKGEVLVSGKLDILNDNKEVVRTEYAQADADVYICYKLNYYQEFSMFYEKPVYTGARKKGYLLQIGNYYFSFKRKTKWAAYDTVTDLKQMKITENFKLPVFYGKSEDFAYEKQAFTYSKKEAEAKAAENLRVLLQSLTEKGFKSLRIMLK